MFQILEFGFTKSWIDGYSYIYRNNKDWMKMINYVDDAQYYAYNDQVRHNFEKKLSKRFHLSLLGKAKWYLRIRTT